MSKQNVIDISAIVEHQRLSRFLVELVLVSWIVTFFDGFDMIMIAYAAPYLAPRFHLNRMMMGNIFSAALFGTIFGAFLFGYIGDKIGRRRAIILAAAIFGFMTLGLALATGYRSLLVLRFIDGMAIGGFLPLIWALNIEYSPKRYRSTLVTVNMIGYAFGGLMCGPLAIWLIPKFGWQAVFIFGGGVTLVATLLLLAFLPESIRFLTSTGRRPALIARIVRRIAPGQPIPAGAQFVIVDEGGQGRRFQPKLLFAGELRWITPTLWIAYACSSLTTFGISLWTPMVLEAMRFTRADAAWAGTIFSFTGILGGLALMRFTDKRGAIAITIMPLLSVPLLLIVGLVGLSHSVLLGLYALVGFTVVGGHTGMHSIAGIFYPSAYRSSGTGWASAIAKIGATAGPFLAGILLSSKLPARNLFAVLAISPAVMTICVFIMGRVHRRILGREELEAPAAPALAVAEQLGN